MRYTNHRWMSFWGALAALGGWISSSPAAETAPAAQTEIVTGAWQHHQVTFSYLGFTSLYTCSGLEGQVRQILLHLGARKDLQVTATGCPGTDGTPSYTAFVHANFYTLAPAADSTGSDTVHARWTPLDVTPRRPSFLGDGDCELIQGMKDIITQNFSLRDVKYRTDCVPHEVWPGSYEVQGQALKAVPIANPVKG